MASIAMIGLGVLLLMPATAALAAQSPLGFGTAGTFSVLAGSGITNTGPTTVSGDIGSFPTPSETGLNTMTIGGVNHAGDAVTQQAKNDLTTAYNTAAGATPAAVVATELGGTTLKPGVYHGATLAITGTLTLDTAGDPNAVFIFQTSSTLITASNSAVIVLNGLLACNVYWQVGSSATLGTGSALIGSVLASTSITAATAAMVQGRLLALNGAVTLDTNTISNNACATGVGTTTTAVAGTTTTAPSTTVPASTTTSVAGTTTTAPSTTVPASTTIAPSTTVPASTTTAPSTTVAQTTKKTAAAASTTSAGSTTLGGTTGGSTTGSAGTPGAGTGTGTNSTAPSTPQITTTGAARPPLPYTGFNPLVPLAGFLLLTLGIVMLGVSKRLDPTCYDGVER